MKEAKIVINSVIMKKAESLKDPLAAKYDL